MSLEQIGQYFGRRDHTTILHSCRKMKDLLQTEPAMRTTVEQVREMLRTRAGVQEEPLAVGVFL
jgi:chromosomal replication initiator protein